MSNYFIYVGFVAAFILLFIIGTRIAASRAARNRRELYDASQASRQSTMYTQSAGPGMQTDGRSLGLPTWQNTGVGNGGLAGVIRVDGAAEGDNQLPSYGAPSIPVPESIYSPTTARYLPPNVPPPHLANGIAAPPEYKYERPTQGESGETGATPPKYEGGSIV